MKDTYLKGRINDTAAVDRSANGRNWKFIALASAWLILMTACLAPSAVKAQVIDQDARSPHALGNNSKQQQKAEKKKAKERARQDKAIKKGKKLHMSYQEKAVRRRMRRNLRKANKWNRH